MKFKSDFVGVNVLCLTAAAIFLVSSAMFSSSRLHAAEVEYVTVERVDGHFFIDFSMKLSVPVQELRHYLVDVEELARVSPTTIESSMITIDDEADPLLRIVLRPCILIFCKRLVKVSHVHEQSSSGSFSRRYIVEPDLSNFRKATETLDLVQIGDGTSFRYQAELEPDFFVPSMIASWLIRRTLVEDLLITARTVEDEFVAAR